MSELAFSVNIKGLFKKSPNVTIKKVRPTTYIEVVGDSNFQKEIKDAFNILLSKEVGKKLLAEVFDNMSRKKANVIVYQYKRSFVQMTNPNLYVIAFDINETSMDEDNGRGPGSISLDAPIAVNLGHELEHIRQRLTKINNDGITHGTNYNYDPQNPKKEDFETGIKVVPYNEVMAVEFENLLREELGLEYRTHYGGVNVYQKVMAFLADELIPIKDKGNDAYMLERSKTRVPTHIKTFYTIKKEDNLFYIYEETDKDIIKTMVLQDAIKNSKVIKSVHLYDDSKSNIFLEYDLKFKLEKSLNEYLPDNLKIKKSEQLEYMYKEAQTMLIYRTREVWFRDDFSEEGYKIGYIKYEG